MRQVKGFIQIYSRQARDRIIKAGQKVLKQAGLEVLSSELFACVDELIKNAVKANYKYILLRELICDRFACIWPEKTPDDNNEDIDDLIRMPERFDRIAEEILTTNDISSAVREILNEESRLLTIKNRIYGENRHYHPEEKAIIKSLNTINRIRNDIKEHNIRIILRIQIDKHFIYIEVTNTAPILNRDINRIHEKREEQRHCRDEGREHDFFIENIDTSESGFGLGYAKIDVILNSCGIGEGLPITIISSINTTVMLTLPLDKLNELFKSYLRPEKYTPGERGHGSIFQQRHTFWRRNTESSAYLCRPMARCGHGGRYNSGQ